MNSCLAIENDELIAANCSEINEQFWLIDEKGFLINKTGKYVTKKLELKGIPAMFNKNSVFVNKTGKYVTNKLQLKGIPAMFKKNHVFVYNKFHETLISAKTFKAIRSVDGKMELSIYLKDGNVSSEYKWKVVA